MSSDRGLESLPPQLSVVIVVVSGSDHLEGCLDALDKQRNRPSMEIIVPYSSIQEIISDFKFRFPDVRFHRVDAMESGTTEMSHEKLDELRAAGLDLARGELIALSEDHGRVDPFWATNMVEAHKNPCVAVGGAIENGVDHVLNWAVYFCDFLRYQRPFQEGPSRYVSDVNISYKRQALENIREVWRKSYHETVVNEALQAKGHTLWLTPRVVLHQHRMGLNLATALRERFEWGCVYAKIRSKTIPAATRLFYLFGFPVLPFLLLGRKIRDILAKRSFIGAFIKAFPLTLLLTFVWSIGEFVGYLTFHREENQE